MGKSYVWNRVLAVLTAIPLFALAVYYAAALLSSVASATMNAAMNHFMRESIAPVAESASYLIVTGQQLGAVERMQPPLWHWEFIANPGGLAWLAGLLVATMVFMSGTDLLMRTPLGDALQPARAR